MQRKAEIVLGYKRANIPVPGSAGVVGGTYWVVAGVVSGDVVVTGATVVGPVVVRLPSERNG